MDESSATEQWMDERSATEQWIGKMEDGSHVRTDTTGLYLFSHWFLQACIDACCFEITNHSAKMSHWICPSEASQSVLGISCVSCISNKENESGNFVKIL